MLGYVGMLFALCAQDAHTVAHPRFEGWSSCKPGSWVGVRKETFARTGRTVWDITRRKRSGDAAAVTLDVETVKQNGRTGRRASKSTERIPATYTTHLTHEDAVVKTGVETLELAGRRLRCRWTEEAYPNGADARWYVRKTWRAAEIPGGIARTEITLAGRPDLAEVVTGWRREL